MKPWPQHEEPEGATVPSLGAGKPAETGNREGMNSQGVGPATHLLPSAVDRCPRAALSPPELSPAAPLGRSRPCGRNCRGHRVPGFCWTGVEEILWGEAGPLATAPSLPAPQRHLGVVLLGQKLIF